MLIRPITSHFIFWHISGFLGKDAVNYAIFHLWHAKASNAICVGSYMCKCWSVNQHYLSALWSVLFNCHNTQNASGTIYNAASMGEEDIMNFPRVVLVHSSSKIWWWNYANINNIHDSIFAKYIESHKFWCIEIQFTVCFAIFREFIQVDVKKTIFWLALSYFYINVMSLYH